jgi:hypothetical protein
MKNRLILIITSLLSIVFFSLHWAYEVARGIEPGGLEGVGGLLILSVWLYGSLALADRRSGLIILLLGSIFAAGVPVLHMQGVGLVGGRIAANSSGAFFWVWTLLALGATGFFSFLLTARTIWREWKNRSPQRT